VRIARDDKTQKPGAVGRDRLQASRSLDEKPIEVAEEPNGMWGCRRGNTPNVAGRNKTAKGKNPMSVGGSKTPAWMAMVGLA
jgi:hypothetical protein